ncbi:MAG: NAD(P)/FAD-dependent oxidoreductase [Actinobacteria bacterium]|nr:NAD(P)/FAD-dependent oxidoreductase [Actinomycetota bacterium]
MLNRANTDFDAIVVGAGHNGLTCAAYLARHGVRTLLLEARHSVGGTAASESFDGATVNICNCDHLTFRTTPIAEELDLASHGLSYIDMTPSQINGDWESRRFWGLHHDVEETVESLANVHPAAAAGYRRYARDTVPVARLITEAANNPPTRGSLLTHVMRRGGKGVARMTRSSSGCAILLPPHREWWTNGGCTERNRDTNPRSTLSSRRTRSSGASMDRPVRPPSSSVPPSLRCARGRRVWPTAR